jgi:predicted RNase H-like HicB family nuclease
MSTTPDTPTTFTVSDGDLVLHLQPAGDGWYAVTSPVEPHLHTQAKSVEEAFRMARDGLEGLQAARAHVAEAVNKALVAA